MAEHRITTKSNIQYMQNFRILIMKIISMTQDILCMLVFISTMYCYMLFKGTQIILFVCVVFSIQYLIGPYMFL